MIEVKIEPRCGTYYATRAYYNYPERLPYKAFNTTVGNAIITNQRARHSLESFYGECRTWDDEGNTLTAIFEPRYCEWDKRCSYFHDNFDCEYYIL